MSAATAPIALKDTERKRRGPRMPIELRFAKYVGEPDQNGCRNWLGGKYAQGYGCF